MIEESLYEKIDKRGVRACKEIIDLVNKKNIQYATQAVGVYAAKLLVNNIKLTQPLLNELGYRLEAASPPISLEYKTFLEGNDAMLLWYQEQILDRLDILTCVCHDKLVLTKDVLWYITSDGIRGTRGSLESGNLPNNDSVDASLLGTDTVSSIRKNSTSSLETKSLVTISSPQVFTHRRDKLAREQEESNKSKIRTVGVVLTIGCSTALAGPTHGFSLLFPFVVGNLCNFISSQINKNSSEQGALVPHASRIIYFSPTQQAGKEAFEYIARICGGMYGDLEQVFSPSERKKISSIVQSTVDVYCKELEEKIELSQSQKNASSEGTRQCMQKKEEERRDKWVQKEQERDKSSCSVM